MRLEYSFGVFYQLTNQPINKTSIPKFAAEIQEAIIDCLVEKSIRAMKTYKPKSFLLGGGVAANKRLREKFLKRIKSEKLQVFHVSKRTYCTDNAAMVGAAAVFEASPLPALRVKPDPGLAMVDT